MYTGAVSQYIGFVEDRLSKAGRALDEAEPALRAASKFLYHAMHKLSQLRSIAAGDVRPNEPLSLGYPALSFR